MGHAQRKWDWWRVLGRVYIPWLHRGRASSAKGSRTTWHRSGAPTRASASWLAVGTACTGARCAVHRWPWHIYQGHSIKILVTDVLDHVEYRLIFKAVFRVQRTLYFLFNDIVWRVFSIASLRSSNASGLPDTYFLFVIFCVLRLRSWVPVRRTPSTLPKEDMVANLAKTVLFWLICWPLYCLVRRGVTFSPRQ